jgi:hypothetical protein
MKYTLATLMIATAMMLSACNSGDAAPAPAGAPTVVTSQITLIAPATPETGKTSVQISDAGGQSPVIGGVDGLSGNVRKGGRVLVVGWAVDLQFGAPVTRVDVILDGKVSVQAELGDKRPDVARTLNRGDVALAGWVATFDLANVEPGDHTISVLVYDTKQQAHILPFSYPFKVAP